MPRLRPDSGGHYGRGHTVAARQRRPGRGGAPPRPPAAPGPGGADGRGPGTPAAARGYLRDAEDAASGALLAHLATAPPSLAQLLASISASEATHALILGTAARHS